MFTYMLCKKNETVKLSEYFQVIYNNVNYTLNNRNLRFNYYTIICAGF